MGSKEAIKGVIHSSAVSAAARRDNYEARLANDAEYGLSRSPAQFALRGLHRLIADVAEGVEEFITPDEGLSTLLASRRGVGHEKVE
jgi:hypothetical protein